MRSTDKNSTFRMLQQQSTDEGNSTAEQNYSEESPEMSPTVLNTHINKHVPMVASGDGAFLVVKKCAGESGSYGAEAETTQ